MAVAVVRTNPAAGQLPDAPVPLRFEVLWDPAPALTSRSLIAVCSTQAEANAVAGLHPA